MAFSVDEKAVIFDSPASVLGFDFWLELDFKLILSVRDG